MADRPRDSRGRFTGGGGGGGVDSVGGIEATVSIDTQAFTPEIARIVAGLEGLETQFAATGNIAATATTKIDAGMKNAAKGASGFGYQLQVVGQGLDDLQYVGEMGLRPIINNLMQISPQLGIAAIAANTLYQNMELFVGASEHTPTAAEEMKKLGEATKLTADQQERYNRLKGQESGNQANQGGGSEADKKVMTGVGKAIDEAGFGAVKEAVQAARVAGGMAAKMTPAEAAELRMAQFQDAKEAEQLGDLAEGGRATATLKKIQERIAADDNEAVEKFLGDARGVAGPEGDGARKALRDMAGAGGFPNGFTSDLDAALGGGGGSSKADVAAEKKLKEQLDKADKENEKRRLGRAHREGEADRHALDAREKAGDAEHKQAVDRVEELKRLQAEKERENEEKTREFDQGERDRGRLTERGSDLNWRLRLLTQPNKEGQSLSGDAYEASFKSMSGDSPEVKKLHAIQEVLEDIRRNNEQIKVIGVKRR